MSYSGVEPVTDSRRLRSLFVNRLLQAKGLLMTVFRLALLFCSLYMPVSPFASPAVAGPPPPVPAPLAAPAAVDSPHVRELTHFLPSSSGPATVGSASLEPASALLRLLYTADTRGALFPCPT